MPVAFSLADFHPRLVALTGTEEQIKAVAKAYRVYYSRPDNSDTDDYLVDHTIIMYLLDPSGTFAAYYGQNTDVGEMAKRIAKHISNTEGKV